MNDSRTPFGDRLDDLAANATRTTNLRHPALEATRSARPSWLPRAGWAMAAVVLVLGGLAVWRITDDPSTVTTTADSDDGGDGGAAGACDAGAALDLLQSGLPAYDYEPAGSYRAAAEMATDVVSGTITSIVRTEPTNASTSDGFTELTVGDVTQLDGTARPDITVVAYWSLWSDRSLDDPLAEPVAVDGLHFVGFLTPWSGVRGDYNPGVEGLYVACGTDTPARPVIGSAAGEGEPAEPTLDELIALLTAPTTTIECTDPGGLDAVVELIDPGFDFDYDPAGSIATLAAQADLVVAGRLTEIRRVANDGPRIEQFFTVLGIDDLRGPDGSEVTVVDGISLASFWSDDLGPDPLADGVATSGVDVVAFVDIDSGVPGGAVPWVEGLYVACGRTSPVQAVIESAIGPDDPADATIDDLLAIAAGPIVDDVDPPTEFTAEEAGYIRDALVQFATGELLAIEEIPLAAQVGLALGSDIERIETNVDLRDPAAWVIDRPDGYAGFSGPFSALDVLASAGSDTTVTLGEHPHCAGDPLPAPEGVDGLVQISIQPAEGSIDSCIDWFSVDVFYDEDSGTIQVIGLTLFGP